MNYDITHNNPNLVPLSRLQILYLTEFVIKKDICHPKTRPQDDPHRGEMHDINLNDDIITSNKRERLFLLSVMHLLNVSKEKQHNEHPLMAEAYRKIRGEDTPNN